MTKQELVEAVRLREQGRWKQAASRSRFLSRAGFLLVALRRPIHVRAITLSIAALATGGLGLLAALAIASEDDLRTRLFTAGQPVRIATVTGPGGTTTVALARTKGGETRTVPVRVVRTLPAQSGEPVRTEVRYLTETEVVKQLQPVTVVVTNSEAFTVTETVVLEVTTTLPPGQTKTKTKP
jgi:hypothetical protein